MDTKEALNNLSKAMVEFGMSIGQTWQAVEALTSAIPDLPLPERKWHHRVKGVWCWLWFHKWVDWGKKGSIVCERCNFSIEGFD